MTTTKDELNDDISDILGGLDILRSTARSLPTDPDLVRVRETTPEFTEQCPKCRGTGRFTSWSGRQLGECYTCKGRGQRSFKSSPAQRGQAREARAALPVRRWEAFVQVYGPEAAWIIQKAPTFAFAASMKVAAEKYGDLTENQLAAVRNCMARETQKTVTTPARSEAVDASKIVEAIGKGKEAGLIWITLRFDGIVIKEAKKFPGTLYVLHATKTDGTGKKRYLGKIPGGRCLPAGACTPEDQARVVLIASDPASAAKVYGNLTNKCCVCGRGLTNRQSVEEGIGPICSNRVGWTKGGLRVQALTGDSRPSEF